MSLTFFHSEDVFTLSEKKGKELDRCFPRFCIDSRPEKKYHILDKNRKEEEKWHLVKSLLRA